MNVNKSSLDLLVAVFLRWNQRLNLSAIRDEAGVREKHIADSLLATEFVNFADKTVLDLGAGGGWPTLPLAITCPTAQFTALDSVGKKMTAVAAMADELELKNVQTIHGRIEDFGQDRRHREHYDIVTARALAPWPVLLEYALPFVKVGGQFVAYQGPQIREDLANFKHLETRLGGKITAVHETTLGEAERLFVVIEKVKATPRNYPRSNGVPRKEPLVG